MDIHPPTGPTHSFKDFAIHILIVTIGILIAFSLEGVREAWREHNQVAETRAAFSKELRFDQDHFKQDTANLKEVGVALDAALNALPGAVKDPARMNTLVGQIRPGFYFFTTRAWESAVASGVLSHLDEDERDRFEGVYLSVKNYQDAQKSAIGNWFSAKVWFASRHLFTPADLVTAEEKLRAFEASVEILDHIGGEFADALKETVSN